MIEISHLSKGYPQQPVLRDICATLPAGGITSIIGANGAGKSTLLSVIGRLLQPDSGSVTVDGLRVSEANSGQLAQRLAVLRQENHLTSRLTVRELVSFGRYPYSKGRLTADDRQPIRQALEFLDLLALQDRYLDQLSGGQRQRAFVAMVLCQDTPWILLDEPLNNLDMKHSVLMMRQLKQAAQQLNKSVLLVIHDINFASVWSDYILAMKRGEVIFKGTPQQVMTPEVLEKIFDLPVNISEIGGQRIAIYYRS